MRNPFAAGLAAASLAAAGIAAQEVERVDEMTDWSVFEAEDPKECFIASPPTGWTAERQGQTVEVSRGDILLMVTFRPADGVEAEVSFEAGYPFRDGSTVSVQIGQSSFELFTDDETAWPAAPSEDQKMIVAMRRGVQAVLVGTSSRGTQTTDTFSLIGFTAALEKAEELCQ